MSTRVVPNRFTAHPADEIKPGTPTITRGVVTGEARGRVIAFKSTWTLDEVPFVNGPVDFEGLVAYETTCARGDSGAAVLEDHSMPTQARVLGIHTAGRIDGRIGLFQPLGPIMSKHGLELATVM